MSLDFLIFFFSAKEHFLQHAILTRSPGKAISGLDVMVIFAKACAALILPTPVLSDASGIKACGGKQ